MKECCANCALMYKAHKTDFTKLNTDEDIDSVLEGYICMAFACERVATQMVGGDPKTGICEMYTPKKCCETCKWIDTDPYDHGLVCVNADSPYCAELWARPDDVCDFWERKDNE